MFIFTVVGERRIIRFLRGKQLNVEQASNMMKDFLDWRKKNNVDAVRQDIVYGGKDTPFKFPRGQLILELVPQICMSSHAKDKKGRPLSESFFQFLHFLQV
jgi:hypothetical protein